jgi:uncharacterized membrane protein
MAAAGRSRLYYCLYLAALATWVSMIFVAPAIASSRKLRPLSGPIYFVFSAVCHQREDRCMHFLGEPLAACSRCTFIYIGILASSLLYPFTGWPKRPRVRYLFIAAAPLIIDGGTQLVGFRESTNTIRAITGFVFGSAIAFYVAPEAIPVAYLVLDRLKKGKASATRRL